MTTTLVIDASRRDAQSEGAAIVCMKLGKNTASSFFNIDHLRLFEGSTANPATKSSAATAE